MNRKHRSSIPLAIATACALASNASAYLIDVLPLPMGDMVRTGKATLKTSTPLEAGDIRDLFDGKPYTSVRTNGVTPLVITIEFRHPVKIRQLSLNQKGPGRWTAELAMTAADLETKGGLSYLSFSEFPTENGVPSRMTRTDNPEYYQGIRFLKLTIERTDEDGSVEINDLDIDAFVRLTSLRFSPDTLRPKVGQSVRTTVVAVDDQLNAYPIDGSATIGSAPASLIQWSGMAPELSVKGLASGTGSLSASWKGLEGKVPVKIGAWSPVGVTKERRVKVAVVSQDFAVAGKGGAKLSAIHGWIGADSLVGSTVQALNAVAKPHSRWEVVQRIDDPEVYTASSGERIALDTIVSWLDRNLSIQDPLIRSMYLEFDLASLIAKHDLCGRRNRGEIDELWIPSHPLSGLAESRMAGAGAWNTGAPPVVGTACSEKLPIHRFDLDKGVEAAMGTLAGRFESVMAKVHGRVSRITFPRNPWEMFTTIDAELPGQAAFGRLAAAPNSLTSESANPNYVPFTGDAWATYPQISQKSRMANCLEWGCTGLGRLNWWFRALPHYRGQTDGVLNNWWLYFTDFDSATSLASSLSSGDLPQVRLQYFNTPVRGVPMQLNAMAGSTDGIISKVVFWDGPELIGVDSAAPYSILWTPRDSGTRKIAAEVFDTRGFEAIHAYPYKFVRY